MLSSINILRQRQNVRHFADDILKYIFLNENFWTDKLQQCKSGFVAYLEITCNRNPTQFEMISCKMMFFDLMAYCTIAVEAAYLSLDQNLGGIIKVNFISCRGAWQISER